MAFSGVVHLIALVIAAAAAATDATTITVVNRCSYTIWPGALPGGGARLDPGQSWQLNMPAGTAGARVWPRTGCTFDRSGRGRCITGDCAGALVCRVSGEQPATLAEYTLGQGGNRDFFDLSVIDGFNVPMSFQPVGGAPCRAATCAVDITHECLPELQVPGGCASACGKFGGDTYCCRGQFEHNCPPTNYSRFFKGKCPDAYSYAKDDQTSTFTCPAGTNYQIVLCPARNDLHMDHARSIWIPLLGRIGDKVSGRRLRIKKLHKSIHRYAQLCFTRGLVVSDVPLEETDILRSEADKNNLELVLLTTPTTPTERMERTTKAS